MADVNPILLDAAIRMGLAMTAMLVVAVIMLWGRLLALQDRLERLHDVYQSPPHCAGCLCFTAPRNAAYRRAIEDATKADPDRVLDYTEDDHRARQGVGG